MVTTRNTHWAFARRKKNTRSRRTLRSCVRTIHMKPLQNFLVFLVRFRRLDRGTEQRDVSRKSSEGWTHSALWMPGTGLLWCCRQVQSPSEVRHYMVATATGFLKFPHFFLGNVNFPDQVGETTISQIGPDNRLKPPPPPTPPPSQLSPTHLFMLSTSHVQCKWIKRFLNNGLTGFISFKTPHQHILHFHEKYSTNTPPFMSVKCTNVLLKFHSAWLQFSLTRSGIPWVFPDLEENLFSLNISWPVATMC